MVTKPTRTKEARHYHRGLTPIPPPKSFEELAQKQGLWGKKVDYGALATAAFPTQKDIDEFEEYLEDIKSRPSD